MNKKIWENFRLLSKNNLQQNLKFGSNQTVGLQDV